MYSFCTLFNSLFLPQGLALFESLKKCCNNFHLYVFAFDDNCFNILKNFNFENMTVISLKEFEDEELLSIKANRTTGEYCWTCTPSTIFYVLKKYNIEMCTYIDADLYFFSNPEILLREIGENSVLITSHRYSPEYDQSELYGKYCVQFITFKNDLKGLKVLEWWRDACLKWCFAQEEDGKFGDQKYLDDWLERFENVVELTHPGGGLAAWNIQQYEVFKNSKKLFIKDIYKSSIFEVVFYHFHTIKFNENSELVIYKTYRIPISAETLIYKPYLKHLKNISNMLNKNVNIIRPFKFPPKFKYKIIKYKLRVFIKNILKFVFRIKR